MSEIKIEGYSPEERDTWEYIMNHQFPKIEYMSSVWNEGFKHMRELLSKPTVFEDVAIPHWRILPIDGKSDDLVFFDRLSKGIFNTNIYLRKWSEKDYLPTRCRWHDSFGHLPSLYNDEYSDIMRQIGVLGKAIITTFNEEVGKEYIQWLTRLYWYTIEFGLIREDDGVKAFGAGIISSPGELHHTVISGQGLSKFTPFDLNEIIRTDFEVYDYQHTYFVIEDMYQIQEAIFSLYKKIF